MFLASLPFHFVSPRHNISTFLHSIISASSLLPVIVPIYKVPTLMSEHLLFHTSRCLFTCLPLFLFFFHYVYHNFHRQPAVRHLRQSLVTRDVIDLIWIYQQYTFVCFGKNFLRWMPFLPQPSPFIWAWHWH